MRLVSLLPSATEIVYALDLQDDLVGVSFECDEPPAARSDKTVVVGGQDTRGMTPRQIDDLVRARVAAGADLYTLHADALAALAPDLILTQDLCQVCALPAGQVEQALAHLGCRADVVTLDPHSLLDVLTSILVVGERAGALARAERLVTQLTARLEAVAARVAGLPQRRVAVVEWVDPPFTAGHWVPDLVTAAGGVSVSGAAGGRSVQTTWQAISDTAPEVIIVAPCGFHLADAMEQARGALKHLPAAEVWAIDADGLVVRPGPRLVTGVEAIASILHPEVFGEHDSVARIA